MSNDVSEISSVSAFTAAPLPATQLHAKASPTFDAKLAATRAAKALPASVSTGKPDHNASLAVVCAP